RRDSVFGSEAHRLQPSLHGFQVLSSRFAGLAVRHDFEGHALTFPQLAEAGALDGAEMDKHVLTAILGLDESIALLRVEPLHGTVVHESLLIGISGEPCE